MTDTDTIESLRARLAEVERARRFCAECSRPLGACSSCDELEARADAAESALAATKLRARLAEDAFASAQSHLVAVDAAYAAEREESKKWKAAALDTHGREERWKKLYADGCDALAAARERERVLVEALRPFVCNHPWRCAAPGQQAGCDARAALSSTPTPPAPTCEETDIDDYVCGNPRPCPLHDESDEDTPPAPTEPDARCVYCDHAKSEHVVDGTHCGGGNSGRPGDYNFCDCDAFVTESPAPTVGTCKAPSDEVPLALRCGRPLPCPRHPARKDGEG